MQHSRPKVFFIGFNKTGTTSIHQFFEKQGYASFHHSKVFDKKRQFLGKVIKDNFDKNQQLLKGIDSEQIYSDFCFSTKDVYYEANKNFRLLDQQYPNSYFILQTRNEDDWIRSRFLHKSKKEDFYLRSMKALGMSKEELEKFWRSNRRTLHAEIIHYFRRSKNFLIFDIDNDPVDKIIKFLQDDYKLNSAFWKKYNVTK